MPQQCVGILHACATRITRLNSNGSTVVGATGSIVTDTLATLTVTPEIATGTEIEPRSACDAVCFSFRAPDTYKRLNVELDFCKADFYAAELLDGGTLLSVGSGSTLRVGYAMGRLNSSVAPNGVSIEIWSRRVTSSGDLDPDFPYLWTVIPRAYMKMGARTFVANAHTAQPFSGFATENSQWGNGPQNDWPTTSLSAINSIPTATLPTTSCGYVATIAS